MVRSSITVGVTVASLVSMVGMVGMVSGCGGEDPGGAPAPWTATPTSTAEGSGTHAGSAGVPSDPEGPRTDRAPIQRGSNGWRLLKPAVDDQVEAYATATSGRPGTRVGIKVSTSERTFRVSAFRIGAYDGGAGHLVWRSRLVRGRRQPAPVLSPAATRTVVAPWRRDLTMGTSEWLPGLYVLKVRTGTGWETLIPYVVSSESAAGTVALVVPVTTWQAYNRWGGYSLYEGPAGDRRSWAVSFDRPWNGATGANDFRTAALPIVVRAEQLGRPLSYFTNIDLHARPGVLAGARGYLSLGHDEYWTPAMRQAVIDARDSGTNLAFLGANTMYWRIRLEGSDSGPHRIVVGYRADAHLDPRRDDRPREATSRFRDPPVPLPEHDLVGMQYECFPVDTDYVVVSPGWWGFRGTDVRDGDRVRGLVGPEADRVYPDKRLPRPLQILSHAPYLCRGVATSAQSVYYTVASGAGVFTAGTLRWGCAIVDRCEYPLGAATGRFVNTVTANLVREFARGPVGRRHPAQDNVGAFDLPVGNLVPAS